MAIPSADLADFLSGNPLRKTAFVQELGNAYDKIGFVAVKNHGIPYGLQILTKQNKYVAVTSLPDQVVVNVSDMLQRFTNNKLCSNTHRVVNPAKELWHTSRFSIPFFLHPKGSMSLRCLDSCSDTKHPKLYPDATAGEYLDERLIEIGLKK